MHSLLIKLVAFAAAVFLLLSCDRVATSVDATPVDLLRDIPPTNSEGSVNAVIEIPAGDHEKYETNKMTGQLEWTNNEASEPRMVHYLPYPANYGMIPRTWLPPSEQGDNDPLDVFVLGQRVKRGDVVPCRVIGVIHVLDRGEHDHKLIAVPTNGMFGHVKNLAELEAVCSECTALLVTWLENYKGRDVKVEVNGVSDEHVANRILQRAINAFAGFEASLSGGQ